MEHHPDHVIDIDGELIAELLDQDEYPSNIGNVVAVSDRQICLLRRDWHELNHLKLEYVEMSDCRAIEYHKELVYYRIVAGIAFLVAAAVLLFLLATQSESITGQDAPVVVAIVMFLAFGFRFILSTHRHVIRFEMPDEVLSWRSPAIDFNYKVEAAHAVRDFARERGILRPFAAK